MNRIFPILLIATICHAKDVAFLWIPPKEVDFSAFSSSIPASFRLTIACQPNECRPIEDLILKGNFEQAAAPTGLPFASILYFPSSINIDYFKTIDDNPYMFALLINNSRKQETPTPIYGFLTPYGDLNVSQLSLYKTLGYSWAAAGKHRQKQGCVFDYNGIKIPSFEVYYSTQQVFSSSCPFFIIDDSVYSVDYSTQIFFSILAEKDLNFINVSQAVALSTATSINDSEISFYPWVGYKDYLSQENMYAYIKTLSLVKKDISNFINSNPKYEKQLLEQYIEAERLIKDLKNSADVSQVEQEASSALTAIYQLMGKQAPDFVYRPFFEKKEEKNYKVSQKENSIFFSAIDPNLSIYEFSVVKQPKGLSFTLKTTTSSTIEELAIYLDINSTVAAGNNSLLNRVKEKLYTKNAWDYALTFEKDSVTLYSYSFYYLKKLRTYMLKRINGELQFLIPSQDIPQNFEKWKYAVINSSNGLIIDGIYREMDNGVIYPL